VRDHDDEIAVGVRFTETMTGHFMPGVVPSPAFDRREYEEAERCGKAAGHAISLTLTITMPHLRDPGDPARHTGVARGQARVEPLTEPGAPAEIRDGVFQLYVEPPADGASARAERQMIYRLPFVDADGRPYLLDGVKVVRDNRELLDPWATNTTLYTVIRAGHDRGGAIVGAGIVHIRLRDFLRQLTTMRVVGAGDVGARLDGATGFLRLFFGGLWEVFVAPRLGPPDAVAR